MTRLRTVGMHNLRFRGTTGRLAGAMLLMALLVGCGERAEQVPEGFTPRVTTIDKAGVSLAWDAEEDLPVVQVMINGSGPFRFLVDTGASHVLVDPRVAERLRLTLHGAPTALRTAANTNVDTEQRAIITTLDIGDAHFADFNAYVFDFTRMEIDGDMPIQIDGILGSALFAHTLLTIDYPNRRINLTTGSLPEVNANDIVPLNLDSFVPYALIRLETRNQIQERWAAIDTGSSGGLGVGSEWGLTYATATIDGGLSMTASGLVMDPHARIERMRLGDLTFVGPQVEIRENQRNPRIGQELLSGMRMTLDLANQRARFQAVERTITLGPSWSHGFSARPCRKPGEEGRIVNWIAQDSPAAKFLQLGDRVLTVNGQSTAHMSNRTHKELMQRPIALTVARSSMTVAVSSTVSDRLPWTAQSRAAPELSHAFALYSLGCAYFNGLGMPKDVATALPWFTQAAELNDAGAQNLLGAFSIQGPLPKDPAVALAWLRKSAEQGYSEAQCNLGRLYGEGHGVAKNEAQAFAWFRKAAEQGNVDAQQFVGRMYGNGIGVAKDETQAATWFLRAAAQNNAGAQRTMGWIYANGQGLPRDEGKAVEWYRKAAEQNDAVAQASLAWMYGNGRGVPRDEAACLMWYTKAAEQGNDNAQTALGWIHANGRGVPQDHSKAFEWYRKAAEQGNASAQNEVGLIYGLGRGVPKDERASMSWFHKAAEQDNADAQKNLAIIYANGLGITADPTAAFAWFMKAATQGQAEAQTNLGVMYVDGRGVEKDLTQARLWFRKAAEQGNAQSQANLGMLYADGSGGEKDLVQARRWLQAAAKQGHVKAQLFLDSLAKPDSTPP